MSYLGAGGPWGTDVLVGLCVDSLCTCGLLGRCLHLFCSLYKNSSNPSIYFTRLINQHLLEWLQIGHPNNSLEDPQANEQVRIPKANMFGGNDMTAMFS